MHTRSQVTFGRRGRPATPLVEPQPSQAFDEAVEQFRDSLSRETDPLEIGFSRWKKSRSTVRLLAWLATFALLASGAACFVLQAPASVSVGLEGIGLAAGWWLRRQRGRHLKAIKEWTPSPQ